MTYHGGSKSAVKHAIGMLTTVRHVEVFDCNDDDRLKPHEVEVLVRSAVDAFDDQEIASALYLALPIGITTLGSVECTVEGSTIRFSRLTEIALTVDVKVKVTDR